MMNQEYRLKLAELNAQQQVRTATISSTRTGRKVVCLQLNPADSPRTRQLKADGVLPDFPLPALHMPPIVENAGNGIRDIRIDEDVDPAAIGFVDALPESLRAAEEREKREQAELEERRARNLARIAEEEARKPEAQAPQKLSKCQRRYRNKKAAQEH